MGKKSTKTVIEFETKKDLWSIVQEWSVKADFRLIETIDSDCRLYQRGFSYLAAPIMLRITKKGDIVHIESWITVKLITRIFTWFAYPSQMNIESTIFIGGSIKGIARSAINYLLELLDAGISIK